MIELKNLPALPAAILNAEDLAATQDHITTVQLWIDQLNLQAAGIEIVKLFQEHPALSSFTVEFDADGDDEGGIYYYPSPDVTSDTPDESVCQENYDAVCQFLRNYDEDYFDEATTFARTADPLLQAEAVMQQLLEPAAFAEWQKAGLNRSTPAGSAKSSASPL